MSAWVSEVDRFIGTKVRVLRKVRGWTQTELGALVDRTPAQMSGYETGQISVSATLVWRLAKALRVNIRDLFPTV